MYGYIYIDLYIYQGHLSTRICIYKTRSSTQILTWVIDPGIFGKANITFKAIGSGKTTLKYTWLEQTFFSDSYVLY